MEPKPQQEKNGAALVRFEAKRPVQSAGTLRGLLELQKAQIAEVLPKHLTAERMAKLVLIAANRQPKILQCSQESVLRAVMGAAELGLDISGTLGEAYLVPYGNECQLIIGYKGLAKLARQSGELRRIEAEVVYEHDHFDFEKGTTLRLSFKPNLGDRGKPIGAYALVEFADGGIQTEWMPASEIDKVRRASKASGAGPWKDWTDEMWRKTAFRRLAKWLPLSSEKFARAVELSDAEVDLSAHRSATLSNESRGLNERLGLSVPSAEPDAEIETDQEWEAARAEGENELFS